MTSILISKNKEISGFASSCYGFSDKPDRVAQFEELLESNILEEQGIVQLKTFAITGTARLEDTTESFHNMIETIVNKKYNQGFRFCTVGACSGVDIQVANVISEFNTNKIEGEETLKLVCVNAADSNGTPDEIDSSIPYDIVVNLKCHFKVRDAYLMKHSEEVVAAVPIPQKFWKSSTPVKSINFCNHINKTVDILVCDEKSNIWNNATKENLENLDKEF
jgi:hypothetical protein